MKIEPPKNSTHYYLTHCDSRGVLEISFFRERDGDWWKVSPSGEEQKMHKNGFHEYLTEIGVKN